MKAKHLFLAIAALLAAGGLWFARTAWRAHASHKSGTDAAFKMPHGSHLDSNSAAFLPSASPTGPAPAQHSRPTPGQVLDSPARLVPPVPNRRFTDFTPEERVKFARQGHGPGG